MAVAVTVTSARNSKSKVEIAFEKHGLTKYIKVPPKVYLTAEYSDHVFVDLGNELTPAQVPKPPQKSFPADENSKYCIIFLDLSYSSNPNVQYMSGLIMNIPGDHVAKGEIVGDYISPRPAEGTGYHYLVSLVYEQPGTIDTEEVKRDNPGIAHPDTFSLSEFTARYCLGDPYAGNFFKIKYQPL